MVKMVKNELEAMTALKGHENVVSFTGDASFDIDTGIIRIYLEYYPGGALDDLVEEQSLRR